MLIDPIEIRKAFLHHCKHLYASQEPTSFDISSLGLIKITPEECAFLQEPVTPLEVKEAILSCDSSKVPGYDGYNLNNIKHVWPIIGEEFSGYIIHLFETGQLSPSINTTWVTLISKKKDATGVNGYRPIHMVGSIYKVIAKNLSRRLREVLPT